MNILEAQLKSNRKHSSIINAVIETIHHLIKDTADNDLMKVMDQIKGNGIGGRIPKKSDFISEKH